MVLELVVFDMDDTLYLERDYVRSGFEAVGAYLDQNYCLQGFAAAAWGLFLKGARGDTFNRALTELTGTAPKTLVSECVDIYRSHYPKIKMLDDAQRLLNSLGGKQTALITDGPSESQSAKAKALGLYAKLDRVILTDELGPGAGKPSRRSFQMLEGEFGYSGQQCIYIGDNPAKDFGAPLSLGWATWRVRRPQSLHEAVATSNPNTVTTRDLTPDGHFLLGLTPN